MKFHNSFAPIKESNVIKVTSGKLKKKISDPTIHLLLFQKKEKENKGKQVS